MCVHGLCYVVYFERAFLFGLVCLGVLEGNIFDRSDRFSQDEHNKEHQVFKKAIKKNTDSF
jgi:hypothetical protein